MKREIIAYYRVSTERQGRSGLGLEAQQHAVAAYAKQNSLLAEYTEIESGAKGARPQLAAALAHCHKAGALLLVAKLDRLTRDPDFLGQLFKSGAEFHALDMPEANKLMLRVMIAFAEHEREQISARTKAALAAAKVRGVRLGNPNPKPAAMRGRATQDAQAANFAADILPVVREIEAAGVKTLSGIAAALNARGVKTRRGGFWHPTTVKNVISRI